MLKKLRVALAAVFFAAVTLLFLDFTGTLHAWLGWMAEIQFIPAVLALNAAAVLALTVLTLVFGRVYCSVICPLGVFQDIVSWKNGKRGKKYRNRFSYSPAKSWLRYPFLVIFIAALAAGIFSLAALLDPYASYGRIASNLFAPLWQLGNNFLAWIAEKADSYAFYSTDVWLRSLPTFVIAILTFIIIAVLAWRGGRTYCNTVCPVGTVLGFLSRFAMFRPVIDAGKCRECSLCSRGCKASCIDYKNHRIDYSRCVDCMDCMETCRDGAISYRFAYGKRTAKTDGKAGSAGVRKNEDSGKAENSGTSRRTFIASAVMAASAATLKAQEMKLDGGLAEIQDKKIPDRTTRIVPAGALGISHFAQHCTACQLCVSVCPEQVLRPSASLLTLMQPEMSYERGYCRTECTKCSDVCPAGAISPVTVEEKSSIQIGHAVVIRENCIVNTDEVSCGNCERHCPTGAITMVPPDGNGENSAHGRDGGGQGNGRQHRHGRELRIPVVNVEKCIGCGACENLCPARPFSAIYVEGHQVHKII